MRGMREIGQIGHSGAFRGQTQAAEHLGDVLGGSLEEAELQGGLAAHRGAHAGAGLSALCESVLRPTLGLEIGGFPCVFPAFRSRVSLKRA